MSAAKAEEEGPRLIGQFCVGNVTKYRAVDFDGVRYHLGDHVIVYYGGREWVVKITDLWQSKLSSTPKFRHVWYWTPHDIRMYNSALSTFFSEDERHEVLQGTNQDTNDVAMIQRRCTVLCRDQFRALFRGLSSDRRKKLGDVFLCTRMFCQYDGVVTNLGRLLFPGDSIPEDVMRKANMWRNKYELCKVVPDNEKPYDEQGRAKPLEENQFEYDGVFVID